MKASRLSVFCSLVLFILTPARAQEISHSRIKRQPVSSSNVASVGYSKQLHALEIEFVRGAIYRYLDVQPQLYRRLLATESKGRFIAENLRGKYHFVRVHAATRAPRVSENIAARQR